MLPSLRNRTRLFVVTLAAVLAFFAPSDATAQDALHGPSLRDQGRALPVSSPHSCHSCLFYGGDFDANNPGANAVMDGQTPAGDGEVYVPFVVPQGQRWNVRGLMVNVLATASVAPRQAYWEIRQGVSSGNGGTLVASGTGPAAFGPQFDCGDAAFYCAAVEVNGIEVHLASGRYWLLLEPQCTDANKCSGVSYYAADVEDNPPPHHYGPLEPWDASFFSSDTFGDSFAPTWGASGVCEGTGCDRFSAGVMGISAGN